MGCGKSKHANVASENTVLKRKTSTVQSKKRKEIETEIIKSNINDDVTISGLVDKESKTVKDASGSYDVKDQVENEHVQEEIMYEKSKENIGVLEKKEEIIPEGKPEKLTKENKVTLENFGEKEDSSKMNDQKMDIANAEEKEIPEKNVLTAKKAEGEQEELLEKNDEELNVSLEVLNGKETILNEKETKSEDSECGKGDSLDENSHKVNDDVVEVLKEPEEKQKEENAVVDVSPQEETLIMEKDNDEGLEASTLKSEKDVIKAEDNTETNIVSASESEDKDLKSEKIQSGNPPSNEDVKRE